MAFKRKAAVLERSKLIKTGAKIKKLKKMMRDKSKHTELTVWEGGKQGITLLPPGSSREIGDYAKIANFDPRKYLYDELVDIVDLLSTAKQVYRDLPDGENASSLTMLLGEMRGFVGDLYQITQEDKDNIYKKLNRDTIQPFMRNLIRGIVTELDSMRKQLVMSIGEEKADEVTGVVKAAGRNLKPLFSQQYIELMRDVGKVLNVRQDMQPLIDQLDGLVRDKDE